MGTVRILCIGNELASDDGFGIRVGRVLETLDLPKHIAVDIRTMVGLDLLDTLEPTEELIIVDATKTGEPPGTCRSYELEDVASMALPPFCCHGVGLAELLQAIQKVRPEALPKRLAIIGTEAQVIDTCSTALTPEVQLALPKVVETVLKRLGASEDLLAEGLNKAEELKTWQPGPSEILG